jgi:cellulose synthase/poly-beta-1,6-N-acetylglucosamine synthase-like glycosyltransferase
VIPAYSFHMVLLSRVVLGLDWLVALVWLWRVLVWRRMLRKVPDLTQMKIPTESESAPAALPSITVVVPARNEAQDIAATLSSLLDSSGIPLEIIAIDDRSDDETGAIMEEAARKAVALGKKLRVLHVTELPQGWLGKTHAMALAARHATGEWLLFTDADVRFRKDALRRALAFATASKADHFVLMPTLVCGSAGERMMLAFIQVMANFSVRLWHVPDPDARRDAIGIGAFNMIRRDVYDAIGGWESFRMEVVEDLALGMRIKQRGFAQRVAVGQNLISLRWAEGSLGVVENLAKNLFAVFRFRALLLFSFLPVFLLFTLFPFAAAFEGVGADCATAVMIFAVLLAYRRQAEYQPFTAWEALSFPVASALMFYTLLRSMVVVLARGGIFWRGTFYPLSELRKQSAATR